MAITTTIIAVGKIKQSARYLNEGIALYTQRLKGTLDIVFIELAEASASTSIPVERVLQLEAEAILKTCASLEQKAGQPCRRYVLSERGKRLDSEAFSAEVFGPHPFGGRGPSSQTPMIWIIGGAYGTDDLVLKGTGTTCLSLSPLTFPHQLVRLILLEQLYRASTINQNHPYHK